MTDGTPGDDGAILDLPPGSAFEPVTDGFQTQVNQWMQATFGPKISADTTERNHRFLEESLELVQACGCTASEAHQLVDYVFGRPVGDKPQEVGGAMVTLAALCQAQNLSMKACGYAELIRCWHNIDKIRAKQAAKPKHSPLPERAKLDQQQLARALEAEEIARNMSFRVRAAIVAATTGLTYIEAMQHIEWQQHPVYQWAQRKIGAA